MGKRLPGRPGERARRWSSALTAALDPTIHAPNRLQICCLLSGVDTMDYATVREIVGVSESVLSKHLKQLEDAGYLTLDKRASMSRVRTWLSLTRAGRKALDAHLRALRALMAAAETKPR